MVFNSAMFLFAFLPVVFILYRLMPGMKAKNALLAVFSVLFYAFGELPHVVVLLASVSVNWGAGRLFAFPKAKKPVLVVALVLNIGLLVVFKYLDFFIDIFNQLSGLSVAMVGLSLPLGISFYTFSGISYLLDCYYEPEQASRGYGKVLLFMSMFPVMAAGPILGYKNLRPQLETRETSVEKTAAGLRRFLLGLSKKLLIADLVGPLVDAVYGCAAPDARLVILAAVAYSIQIYFDFSGCADMAIGIGGMFGFELPENFRAPYTALSVTEFWSRWHMSLTNWFRTYLYYPLTMSKGLGKLRKRLSKAGKRKLGNRLVSVIALLVVWLLTGLWHGPSWCYILWGLWHGLWNILEGIDVIQPKKIKKTLVGRVALRVYTLLVMLLGVILFRSANLAQAGQFFATLVTGWHFLPECTYLLQTSLTPLCLTALILGIAFSAGLLGLLKKLAGNRAERWSYIACGILFLLCVCSLAGGGFQPFIYAQF